MLYAGAVNCPFCEPAQDRIALHGSSTLVLTDLYPVTPGHLLVVPRRHVAEWNEATLEERSELLADIDRARDFAITHDSAIAGFNIGWNDGPAAGQTVMHLHIHVIPRRVGDVEDPRGGIRWIVPERARYWSD